MRFVFEVGRNGRSTNASVDYMVLELIPGIYRCYDNPCCAFSNAFFAYFAFRAFREPTRLGDVPDARHQTRAEPPSAGATTSRGEGEASSCSRGGRRRRCVRCTCHVGWLHFLQNVVYLSITLLCITSFIDVQKSAQTAIIAV